MSFETKPLSDLCEIQLGGTPHRGTLKFWDKEKNTKNIWISIADLVHGKKMTDSKEYLSDEGCEKVKLIPKDTLMLSFKLTIGRCAFSGCDLRTNEAIASMVNLSDDIDKKYLFYFFSYLDWDYISKDEIKVKGKTLNKAKLSKLQISYPSVEKQKKIVEKLDTCMEKMDKAIQNVEKNIQNVEDLFQSQLNEIFNRNNESYSIEILDNLCNKTSNIKWAEHIYDEFKYVDLSSVDRANLKIENFNYVNHKNAPSRAKKIVKTNDVIFATTRPTLKRVTRINEDFNNQLCSTGYCVLRPREDLILTDIIYYFIQADFFMNEMEKLQKGASYPAVSDKEVKNVEISFPKDIEKQVSISFQLNSLNEKIFDLKNSYLSEIIALNELKESILAKAFNGEL